MLSTRTLQDLTQKWTKSAMGCYLRNCNCSGCYYNYLETNKHCNMKAIVLEMIRIHGKPSEELIQEVTGSNFRAINPNRQSQRKE